MDLIPALIGQYTAALRMLRQAVERCPADLWNRPGEANPTWQLAYHAAFYTHLYLAPSLEAFKPWDKHREKANRFAAQSNSADKAGEELQPFTPAEVLEFIDFLLDHLESSLMRLDMAGPSGFHWQPIGKLGLQFYNLRHLQQHTGELYERLGTAGVVLDWF